MAWPTALTSHNPPGLLRSRHRLSDSPGEIHGVIPSSCMDHYHHERNHQGKGNVLLFPPPSLAEKHDGLIQGRERLGGLLKYSTREAA